MFPRAPVWWLGGIAQGRGTETGLRKPLSRKSNFIIEKSSVLSSLRRRCHKFTYSICRRRNAVGPICIMPLEGLVLLLNLNAAGEEAIIKLYTLAGRETSDGFRLQTLFAVQAADYPRPGSQADSGSEGWENQRVAALGSSRARRSLGLRVQLWLSHVDCWSHCLPVPHK